jgi:hypothetical protein
MKNCFVFFLIGFWGLVVQARADEETRSITGWVLQANFDNSFVLGNLSNDVNPGWGGEYSIGYRFPIDLELSIENGYDAYAGRTGSFNSTWDVTPLVFKVQYGFGNSFIQPYIFLGAGVAFSGKASSPDGSLNNAGETDFLDEGGFGLDLELTGNSSFFVQSKLETDYTSAHYAGGPTFLLFPLIAGFRFLLN